MDIDCIDIHGILMNDAINELSKKYELPFDWINTDFTNTSSFSYKLIQYSSFYKSYCNGALEVMTVKDEYLVAMKMKSARKYKNDYSDIFGIIEENIANNNFTFESVLNAYNSLYGDEEINEEIYNFTKECFNKIRNNN